MAVLRTPVTGGSRGTTPNRVLDSTKYRRGSLSYNDASVSQIAKPQTCLATIVAYVPPKDAIAPHHWSVSTFSGAASLKTDAAGTL